MTKSELIERMLIKQTQLSVKDVELAMKTILDHMCSRYRRVSVLKFEVSAASR
jgi:nucleoid DNA-binding protein